MVEYDFFMSTPKERCMIILDVNKVAKNFGYGTLFENVSFSLQEGESLSIVGENGCGKSTLLKMIAGLEKVEQGEIHIKKGAKIAYLDQVGSSVCDGRLVKEVLKDSFASLLEMEKKLEYYQTLLNENLPEEKYNATLQKYCTLLDVFAREGGYEIDKNIQTVVDGLCLDKTLLNQPFSVLSGGEKTLVQLAKGLLLKPDVFLLDEPTNHLDISRMEWLEKYIKTFKGALVVVSHDRYFLDKISNKILYLCGKNSKVYTTNYTGFLQERQQEYEKQCLLYKNQQQAMQRLETQIKYFAERGMANNSSTLCDRAHALQTQLERLQKEAVEKPKPSQKLRVGFEEEHKNSKQVIVVENVTVCYEENKPILQNVSLTICDKERVAFLGNNGSGKSTLLKLMMGTLQAQVTGKVHVGPSVKIGYLPQIITFAHENQELLSCFQEEACVCEQTAREILAKFHFYKGDVCKKVKNLSGGEKMRVKLALLLQNKINTLIFDEPTNHIDIATKEVLEEALREFEGTLLFVSHDRYFINVFAEKIIEFSHGNLTTYIGNYEDYKNYVHKK